MGSNYDQYKNKLKSFVEKDKLEFEQFLDDYTSKMPAPIKNITWPNIKFWLALVAGISAAAVSGLRIYDRFYSVAASSGSDINISRAEALFAIGAVNITIMALSFANAYNKKKMNERSLVWGLWVAAIISGVAGLGQSFYGLKIESIVGFFDWVLAFTLASVTILEWLMGDLMGIEYNLFKVEKQEKQKEFDQNYKQWYTTARQQFGTWKARFMAWDQKENKVLEEVHEENNEQIQNNNVVKNKTKREYTKASEIVQLIQEVYSNGELPSVTQIVTLLAKQKVEQNEITEQEIEKFINDKKGSVSQQLNRWIEKNSDVQAKYFIKKFTKKNKQLPSANEIMVMSKISNVDANFYLAEFIVKYQNELLKNKIVGVEDIQDAVKLVKVEENSSGDGWD